MAIAINPLRDFGIENIVEEAKRETMELVRPEMQEWLPDGAKYFTV